MGICTAVAFFVVIERFERCIGSAGSGRVSA